MMWLESINSKSILRIWPNGPKANVIEYIEISIETNDCKQKSKIQKLPTVNGKWKSSTKPAAVFHCVFPYLQWIPDVLNYGRIASSVIMKGKQGKNDAHDKHKLHTRQELDLGSSTDRTYRKASASFRSRRSENTLTRWRLCEHGQRLTPHWLHGEWVLARRRHSLVFYTPVHRELLVQSERHLHTAQLLLFKK